MSERPKNKFGLTRVRRQSKDFVDMDYLAKLSPEELAWMDQFSTEYYRAYCPKNKPSLHQDPKVVYAADNARRRDVWNNFQRLTGDPTDLSESDSDESEDK